MGKLARASALAVAVGVVASAAAAYNVNVTIDGSAVQPSTDVKVVFALDGANNDVTIYCEFNAQGQMTGLSPIFQGPNYVLEQMSGYQFILKGLTAPLKRVEAQTGYGNTLTKEWSGSGTTSYQMIGIYRDHIAN